jgi:hypothetical protein
MMTHRVLLPLLLLLPQRFRFNRRKSIERSGQQATENALAMLAQTIENSQFGLISGAYKHDNSIKLP